MRQLRIPGHVHVCRDGDYVVMLDVHRDRYWALEAARTAALSAVVPGWPGDGCDAPADATSAVQLLLDKGLLCDAASGGKAATPIRIDAPRRELLADEFAGAFRSATARASPGIASVARFMFGAVMAFAYLRCLHFERAIERVRSRRPSDDSRDSGGRELDFARAAQLVAAFAMLQPMLFTRRDACLFNSLALIEYLALHGLYPQWVFGVQGRPFAAHCWVQYDGVLFNDTLEHVRRYTPIMVV